MGNCLERPRRGRCSGGDSGGSTHYAKTNAVWVEEEVERKKEEEARKGESAAAAGAGTTTEVKIRITRKQLEELLRRVEDGKHGGAPVRDVVSELLYVASTSSNFRHGDDEGQWRPSLQSIPE